MFFGFDNITIAYKGHTVLQNVSMDFRKGSITSILGLNGTGKSSLLKTIPRMLRPQSGKVILENQDILSFSKADIAKRVAYLSQIHTCPADISVRTLVSYGRFPHRRPGHGLLKTDIHIIDQALEATGMTTLQNRPMSTLSGGESQRAWIAMAIAQEPKILVLDEPTTYLDASYQIEILELLEKLNKEMGLTIVMVLHDLNLASRYSDDLYVIGNGKVLAHGAPNEIITEQGLKDLFNVEAKVLLDEQSGRPFYIPQKSVREGK